MKHKETFFFPDLHLGNFDNEQALMNIGLMVMVQMRIRMVIITAVIMTI